MYEIIYSPTVQEKLSGLRNKLIDLCGEKMGERRLLAVINDFETRLTFSNTGIPVKTIYDVEKEFEKYYIIYSHKNYFIYFIQDNYVNVMEMYDEREDFARTLFGITTTLPETMDYWNE